MSRRTFAAVAWAWALWCGLGAGTSRAAVYYESSPVGATPTGTTDFSFAVSLGVRFEVTSSITATAIGGRMERNANAGDNTFFGALIALTDFADFPDSTDLSSPDVLRSVVFSAPAVNDVPEEVTVAIAAINLAPGVYAIMFGGGERGASGLGAMTAFGADGPNASYFSKVSSDYSNDPVPQDMRFVLHSNPIPEPAGMALLVGAALAILSNRCRWSRIAAR